MIVSMLAACAMGPDFVRPQPPVADSYTRGPLASATLEADSQTQHFDSNTSLTAEWWLMFKSPQLDSVVRRAIRNNPTLQAAEASLRQSQDNLRAGYGVFYPHVNADLDAVRERTAQSQQGLKAPSTVFNLVTLSGTVGYTLDIFGGARRTVEGLRAQADYQGYLAKAAYLTLSANVVNTCIARSAYEAQVHATEQLIALEDQQLRLADVQFQAGTSSYSNVLSLRGSIAANQALLAPLRQRVSQCEDLLPTLEGVVPSKAFLPDIELASIVLPVDLPLSLPSDLVRQRPDILSSESQMHAASANIGVATAAMFPSFNLTGTYGASSNSFSTLSAASGRFWSIGPSATIPLFQGGSLWFGRRAAIDAFQQSQAAYRETVLGAFAQVADSLKALEHDAEALRAQVDSRRAAGENLGLLQANYQAGLVVYSDVLAADIQLHSETIAYLQAVAQRQQDTVALLVALGGGWWNETSTQEEGGAP